MKTRQQIIDEFKAIKEGSYTQVIKVFTVFTVMFLINTYFTGQITPKIILLFVAGAVFIAFEIIFILYEILKKINLLFDLEKIQSTGVKENDDKK